MATVKPEGLADAIARELEAYSEDVFDELAEGVEMAAKTCKKEIQKNSPKLTGDYRKGWRAVKAYESQSDIRFEVHNKTDYQRTHLLEHGHANRDGGRTEGHPHIGPAAEHAAEILLKKAKVAVKK